MRQCGRNIMGIWITFNRLSYEYPLIAGQKVAIENMMMLPLGRVIKNSCRWTFKQKFLFSRKNVSVSAVLAYGFKNTCVTATAVMELIPLFSGRVIVSRVCLEPATYCVLLLCSAESLSTAIIPSKTSAVIPAMFHQSVAVYSEAHCLCMLARTKIMACKCLSARACARLLFFQPPNLLSFLRTNTSKRSWADKLALFSTAVAQWSPACVYK